MLHIRNFTTTFSAGFSWHFTARVLIYLICIFILVVKCKKKLPIQFDVAQQSREKVYTKITKMSISQSNRCLKHHKK